MLLPRLCTELGRKDRGENVLKDVELFREVFGAKRKVVQLR